MGYFNRDARGDRDSNNRSGRDNRGGGRGFSGGRDRGGFSDGPREMFKTVCSNCGKDCEVPFKPTSGKPVYCSDCFEKMGGRNSDSGRPERNDRPEKRERPSFDRHQTPNADNSKQLNDLRSSSEAINAKLDKIIALLTPKIEEKVTELVVTEEVKPEKIEKVKTPKVEIQPKGHKKAKVVKE